MPSNYLIDFCFFLLINILSLFKLLISISCRNMPHISISVRHFFFGAFVFWIVIFHQIYFSYSAFQIVSFRFLTFMLLCFVDVYENISRNHVASTKL